MENKKKRNPELFLHIGLHKTGTSSIQESLIQNKANLAKEGILYINNLKIFDNILNIDFFNIKFADKCITELENISKSKKNTIKKIIISNESFSGNPFNGYKKLKIIVKYLNEISKSFETKIILYLRRQDELIESLYIQSIKSGKTALFNDFIKTLKYDSFNWSNYINIWMQYFSKNQLIVRMYDKEKFKDGNIVTDFASVLESKLLKNDINFYEENKGYSQASLEVAQMLNQYLNEYEKRYVRHFLEKIDTKKRHISSKFYTYKKRQQVLAYFEKCNEELLDKFPFICSSEYFEIDAKRIDPNSSCFEKSKDYDNVISNLISSLINENSTLRYKTKPSLKNLYKMLVYYIKN
tara:strand:+ start:181 stop:1239 length:1059 start_codon:yes stop_codon:yes gene_type:complete